MLTLKRRKAAFSLVEVIVSLTLFAIVLTAIFSLYKHNSLYLNELSRARKATDALHIAQTRLSQIFTNLEMRKNRIFYTSKESSQETKNPSLVFTFDNGIDADNHFANALLGKLFLDEKKRLCLVLWPDKEKFPHEEKTMRKEVLLENIESCQISFWAKSSQIDEKDLDGPFVWVNEWLQEYKSMPAIIKIEITKENSEKPIELSYVVAKKIPMFKL